MLKLKQFVSQDFCLKCQGCCRFSKSRTIWSPRLLDIEQSEYKFKKLRLIRHPKKNIFICGFFLWQDNKCKIYTHRPFDCRLYPFLLKSKGKKVFLAVDLNCPFIQENLYSPGLKQFTRYLTAFFKRTSMQRLLNNNWHFIQEYKQAPTLLELKF